ncbi:MAG: hypothetical protein ACTSR3_03330 [Candidatus Helarchaeota archaeon]
MGIVYDEFDNFYKDKKLYKAGKIVCPYCGEKKMSYYIEDKKLGKTYFLENKDGVKLCKECYVDFLRDEREKEKVAKSL